MIKLHKNKENHKYRTITYFIVVILLNAFLLYNLCTKNIVGFAINADEMVYFSLSKSLFLSFNYQQHAQYNPLYPFLTSFLFYFTKTANVPDLMRFFNGIVFSSMTVPLYLICKRFFKDKAWHYIIPVIIILLPWKTVTSYIVAESYYYTFFVWSVFFYLYFMEEKNIKRAVMLGASIGLLFLLKQAGGIFFMAVILGMLYEFIFVDKLGKKNIKAYITASISALVLILPWVVRNKIVTGGALGYQSEVENIGNNMFNFAALLRCFMSNLSYISLGTCLIFFALFIYKIINIKKQDINRQSFYVMLAFFMAGLLLICSFHYVSVPRVPYGRYSTVLIPIMIIISVSTIITDMQNADMCKKLFITCILAVLLVICLAFDVINVTTYVKGFFNNFDTAIWNSLFFKNAAVWSIEESQEVVLSQQNRILRISIPVVMFLMSAAVIFINNKKIKYLIVFMLLTPAVVFSQTDDKLLTKYLGGAVNSSNEVCKFLVDKQINLNSVYYTDSSKIPEAMLSKAWFLDELSDVKKLPAKTAVSDVFANEDLFFDFGAKDTYIAEGAIEILAPWMPEYMYIPDSLGGLDAKMTFVNKDCTVGSLTSVAYADNTDSKEDSIYGTSENIFTVARGAGTYDITISSDLSAMPFNKNIDFDVYINDKFAGTIKNGGPETLTVTSFKNENDVMAIKLLPRDSNSVWRISSVKVSVSAEKTKSMNNVYLLTKSSVKLPLDTVFENKDYKLYYKK